MADERASAHKPAVAERRPALALRRDTRSRSFLVSRGASAARAARAINRTRSPGPKPSAAGTLRRSPLRQVWIEAEARTEKEKAGKDDDMGEHQDG